MTRARAARWERGEGTGIPLAVMPGLRLPLAVVNLLGRHRDGWLKWDGLLPLAGVSLRVQLEAPL